MELTLPVAFYTIGNMMRNSGAFESGSFCIGYFSFFHLNGRIVSETHPA